MTARTVRLNVKRQNNPDSKALPGRVRAPVEARHEYHQCVHEHCMNPVDRTRKTNRPDYV